MAAIEEERLRRVKHWAGFPSQSIQACLKQQGLTLADVDHVAVNRNPKANWLQKIGYTLGKRPDFDWLLRRVQKHREKTSLLDELQACLPGQSLKAELHEVEHHLAHLASAFLVSPFDKAVVVSIDGFGDFASAAWGVGSGARIEVEDRIYFPHSLGVFYEATTQFLGFPHWGDEYKVMGLAPYGSPKYTELFEQIVGIQSDGTYRLNLEYFRHHKENIASEIFDGEPTTGRLYDDSVENLLGPARKKGEELTQRHKDLARSAQAVYENAFHALLNQLHRRHKIDTLALAGGCAMNSVANGRVYTKTPFRRIYVQSAAGDAGGAVGAALAVWHLIKGREDRHGMPHAYWGPSFGPDEIRRLVTEHESQLPPEKFSVTAYADTAALCRSVVADVVEGKVLGWFQGRMEWGPRALGNRSIIGDPRRKDMKDILNLKIKRRESFRPFAPSILREDVSEWFEVEDDVPFMTQVFQIRAEKRELIPAVTHVDGSGRLQTVTRDSNDRYYDLISEFKRQTGIPMLLNTSFNENEPVVCSPLEALNCFLRTNMDTLALGDHVIRRLTS